MVIVLCSRKSLAWRKGIIGVCILIITIREPEINETGEGTYY